MSNPLVDIDYRNLAPKEWRTATDEEICGVCSSPGYITYIGDNTVDVHCRDCDMAVRKHKCYICSQDVIALNEEDGEFGPAALIKLSCGHCIIDINGHWCDASQDEVEEVRETICALKSFNDLIPKTFEVLKKVIERHSAVCSESSPLVDKTLFAPASGHTGH